MTPALWVVAGCVVVFCLSTLAFAVVTRADRLKDDDT